MKNSTFIMCRFSNTFSEVEVLFVHFLLCFVILLIGIQWVAISFSRGSSWPRGQTWVSYIAGRFFTIWATREAPDISEGGPFWTLTSRIKILGWPKSLFEFAVIAYGNILTNSIHLCYFKPPSLWSFNTARYETHSP